MTNSLNKLFDWCVLFLEELAAVCGTTYKLINVYIFCIAMPLALLILLYLLQRKTAQAKAWKDAHFQITCTFITRTTETLMPKTNEKPAPSASAVDRS